MTEMSLGRSTLPGDAVEGEAVEEPIGEPPS